jgi:hypothetical protein
MSFSDAPGAVADELARRLESQPSVVGTDRLSAETALLFVEGSGSESFDADLLSEGALDADSLTPDSGSRATDVTVEARFSVENGSGTVLARDTATDTATVEVEKAAIDAAEFGTVEGSGGLSIELE